MDLSKAQRIVDTMNTPGWQDIREVIQEIRQEVSEEMDVMLDRDKITLNKAHKLCGIRKGLNQFLDALEQAPRILSPKPKGRRSGGKT